MPVANVPPEQGWYRVKQRLHCPGSYRRVEVGNHVGATSSNCPGCGIGWVMEQGDEEIYRKHSGDLSRLARMLVGPNDAHDVLADAVINATGASTWPRLDNEAKGGYLYRTVVNQARQWGRSRSRRQRRDALYAAQPPPGETSMETDWEVWDTVASLSARQRAVVFLTYWADLDGRGVAEMLGISEGSVRRHLHLARETLRRRLDG